MARSEYAGRAYLSVERAIQAALAIRAPVYKMTDRTLRLSPACTSAVSLPKAVRRAVFRDAIEVDLASSQLALAASLWDVPELRAYLRQARDDGASWWGMLIDHLMDTFPNHAFTPDDFDLVKGALKGNTYGIMFSMAKRNLRSFGNPETMRPAEREAYAAMTTELERIFQAPVRKIGAAFLAHPLVKRLLDRRGKILHFIRSHTGTTDCFGRWVSTEDPGKGGGRRGTSSVLAEFMQNAELFVMLRVGRAALDDSELQLLLWQHDGITVMPRRRSRPSDYTNAVRKLETALAEGLRALEHVVGCPQVETWLTVDYAPEGKVL
jgi:hypothetical protein